MEALAVVVLHVCTLHSAANLPIERWKSRRSIRLQRVLRTAGGEGNVRPRRVTAVTVQQPPAQYRCASALHPALSRNQYMGNILNVNAGYTHRSWRPISRKYCVHGQCPSWMHRDGKLRQRKMDAQKKNTNKNTFLMTTHVRASLYLGARESGTEHCLVAGLARTRRGKGEPVPLS